MQPTELNKKVIIRFLNNLPPSIHVDVLAERIKEKYASRKRQATENTNIK